MFKNHFLILFSIIIFLNVGEIIFASNPASLTFSQPKPKKKLRQFKKNNKFINKAEGKSVSVMGKNGKKNTKPAQLFLSKKEQKKRAKKNIKLLEQRKKKSGRG